MVAARRRAIRRAVQLQAARRANEEDRRACFLSVNVVAFEILARAAVVCDQLPPGGGSERHIRSEEDCAILIRRVLDRPPPPPPGTAPPAEDLFRHRTAALDPGAGAGAGMMAGTGLQQRCGGYCVLHRKFQSLHHIEGSRLQLRRHTWQVRAPYASRAAAVNAAAAAARSGGGLGVRALNKGHVPLDSRTCAIKSSTLCGDTAQNYTSG
mmetsp:Transcript_93800/g.235504  ORF Transcript_93800/g.235504 Transcript_93800/m.235504 type:complete len:210 (+) Transcript_93800:597-1226(+)|eukprot:CAMPEP_0115186226 /NCGR_PEP_ID=MMETSP0270-20121206/9874_1 /TAXON_ID=71861 /ORGANISM="Scrippsiella trochoidea, Strain CCMP3099" /LENGTH=209 /DNA_ID=CAMNT_0002599347 /DNA_START=512 /DNA_END=1141 /DNA_ORIENTATION=-